MNTRSIIELNRRFWLVEDAGHSGKGPADVRRDQREAIESFLSGRPLLPGVAWDELLRLRRVVILAEAGTGKTEEFKLRTRTLLNEGQCAFFCRMESIAEGGDFREALSLEDEARFEEWRSGDAVGYFFIDSVDEAKLRVSSVDAALCSLVRALGDAKGRAHVYLSSRASEWDVGRDFAGFRDHFRDRLGGLPRIAFLLPLNFEQQGLFVAELGLPGGKAMLESARRLGGYLVNRPLDLRSTSEYWGKHGRIDSHMKMVEHSVSENLAEWEPERAKRRPLGLDKARRGAENLAATLTLCGESRIRIPSTEFVRKDEVDASEALPDWGAGEIAALLERPIFDPEIYGAVRFHHREAREYLAASWFKRMLDSGASPLRVLPAFQATKYAKYGETFVRPAMRPVAAWLAQMECGKFFRPMLKLDPAAMMSHGDPSVLPVKFREDVLRASAKKIADNLETQGVYSIPLDRFGGVDIADAVNELLEKFSSNPDVVAFLLRIVRAGKIAACAGKALNVALDESTPEGLRRSAIYAVADASVADASVERYAKALAEAAVNRVDKWTRGTLIGAMHRLFPGAMSIQQFVHCIEKRTETWSEFGGNYLLEGISLEEMATEELREFLDGILTAAKIRSERSGGWGESLTAMLAAKALMPLLSSSNASHEDEGILRSIEALEKYQGMGFTGRDEVVKKISANWRLVHALYWRAFQRKGRAPWVTSKMWRLSDSPELLRAFLSDIREQVDAKKREEAFWAIWRGWHPYGPEKADILAEVRAALSADAALSRKLEECLEQAAKFERRGKRQEVVRSGREQQEKVRKEKELRESVEILRNMSARLRDFGADVPWYVVNNLLYLQQWMLGNNKPKDADESADEHGCPRWESMISVFGEEVARCARDGMMKFWRTYTPPLMSEIRGGRGSWSTPCEVSLGMFGLDMLHREQPDWAGRLKEGDAALAAGYAMHSSNHFPPWVSALIRARPDAVTKSFRPEMEWDMRDLPDNASPNILQPMLFGGEEVGKFFALTALDILEENSLLRKGAQSYVAGLLRFLKKGDPAGRRARFYRERIAEMDGVDERPFWLAEWMRMDAGAALEELKRQLRDMGDSDAAKKFMTVFCGSLGDETRAHDAEGLRDAGLFDNVGNLREILRLTLKYVQDFRSALFSHLAFGCSGEEAYRAMMELSADEALDKHTREVLRLHARRRAESDEKSPAWTPAEVIDFAKKRTPPFGNPDMFFQHVLSVLDEFRDNLENGDFSNAPLLALGSEREAQLWFADRLRERGWGVFAVAREEEVVGRKKPDIRIRSVEGESMISVEVKIADNWPRDELRNALEKQLLQYLRDLKARHGVLLLIYKGGNNQGWKIPGKPPVTFAELTEELKVRAQGLAGESEGVDGIRVVGVDLSKAGR